MRGFQKAIALLQVSGREWDVEATLRLHELKAAWWRAGAGERPTRDAGFNLIIAEAASGADLARQASAWLHQHHQTLLQLVPNGGKGQLHVMVGVDDAQQAVPGMVFDSSALTVLAACRIELALTAYVAQCDRQAA